LSQGDVAAATGTVTSHISAIERGEQNVTLRTLAQIAHVVGVSPEVLLLDPQPAGAEGATDQPPAPSPLRVADVATAARTVVRHLETLGDTERDAPLTPDVIAKIVFIFFEAFRPSTDG
jgi:transcriptional regulator with XRE-family HTH domain